MVQRVQVRYINRGLRHGEGVQSDPRCQQRHQGAKEERCAYPWRQRTSPAEETVLEISGMLRISSCQEFYGGCAVFWPTRFVRLHTQAQAFAMKRLRQLWMRLSPDFRLQK